MSDAVQFIRSGKGLRLSYGTAHPEVGFAPRLAPDLGYDGLSHPAKLVADGSAKRSPE